jgi:hypothetical protein
MGVEKKSNEVVSIKNCDIKDFIKYCWGSYKEDT